MQITNIDKTKRGRYSVFVDGEFMLSVDDETAAEFHLKIGRQTSEDEMNEILKQSNRRKAKEKAYNLLSYKDHSKSSLKSRLKRDISEEAAEETVEKMQELGLIDDEKYAYNLAKDLFTVKCFAARRVLYELTSKGIDKELAAQAVAECEIDPSEQIEKLLSRKFRNIPHDEKGKRRIQDSLARFGYSWDDIRNALRGFFEEQEDSDD